MTSPNRVFLHYLKQLDALLERIAAVEDGIVERRLHPDMFNLLQQASTAIGFSLRTCCPLAGREIVSFRSEEESLAAVRRELAATVDYLRAMPECDIAGKPGSRIATAAGFADLDFAADDYVLMYAMPNFFFHYSMVYAIARQAGVPIGKADFDGYHRYPQGFIFTDEADPDDIGGERRESAC